VLEVFEQPALVEEYIDGREIHAALLGNGAVCEVLPLFEMEFDDSYFRGPDAGWRPHIISYSAKWDPTTEAFYSMEAVCPARASEPLAQRIREIARAAFQVTECRDYARVDMRIDAGGQPYVLEVNPNPDLALGGAFETCAAASGRSYAQTLSAIVQLAAERGAPVERATPTEPAPVTTTDHMWQRHGRKRDAA
jgi:D-alanine-D-alanine ligase